jgi:hypothetical protein
MNNLDLAAPFHFFDYLRNNFDVSIVKDYKNYGTVMEKLINAYARKEFLLKCRSFGIIPCHINNSLKCTFALLKMNSPFKKQLDNRVSK